MAVVLLWRLAVTAGASGAAVRSFFSESGQPGWGAAIEWWLRGRLTHDYSDAEAKDALEAQTGYAWDVATYTGSFELRKLHMIWSQQDAAVASDDSRVCTFHLAKITGGSPDADWVAGDFTDVIARFDTFWGAIKTYYPPQTILDRYKFYKDGPGVAPPQVPVYDADKNVAGTSANGALPPQVAISVTEKAGSKRHWGRFFLPAPDYTACGAYGRLNTTMAGAIADAVDTLYQGLKTDGIEPVVYRRALPVRQTAEEKRNDVTPGSLPARDATAWSVTDIQIDDVIDVMRSRRWKNVTLRTQREIA